MAFGNDELERLADDAYKERRISGTVYCGNCGYNLRTLFYVYRCPECGQEYNARPLVMKGVFLPQNTSPPLADMAAAVLFGAVAYSLIDNATQPFEPVGFVMGLLAAILTVVYFGITLRRGRSYFKCRAIAARIHRYERELAASDND